MTEPKKDWLAEYRTRFSTYEEFCKRLHALLSDLFKHHAIDVSQLQYRAKTLESFGEKIQRKNYADPFSEMTDLAGLRIITYHLEDVTAIDAILKENFSIAPEHSSNKSELLDPDRFGYVSVHYVVSLSDHRAALTEWRPFASMRAEIQVRTVLQHAWAAIDHKLRYKAPKEVPRELRRQLFRLSALLETADAEFSQLRAAMERVGHGYARAVDKGKLDLELNADSLDAYLKANQADARWAKVAISVGFEKPSEDESVNDRSDLLKVLDQTGIHTVAQFDQILQGAESWGRERLMRFCKKAIEQGFTPIAYPVDVLTFLTLLADDTGPREEAVIVSDFIEELQHALRTWREP
jgi:putative GTP pyrophosphokinase